jgi:hypothetical protein
MFFAAALSKKHLLRNPSGPHCRPVHRTQHPRGQKPNMIDAQGQDEFFQNDWQAALDRAVEHLMELLAALDDLEQEIEAQMAVVELLERLAGPPE